MNVDYRMYGLSGLFDWFGDESETNPSMAATYQDAMSRISDHADALRAEGKLEPFAQMVFALDVTEAEARAFQKRAWGLADGMKARGEIGEAWYGEINWFANLGVLIYPSRDKVASDPEAVDAVNALLVKYGFAGLKADILAARMGAVKTEAAELQKQTEFWDRAYTTLEYVSGAVAVQKCVEYVAKIGESVRGTRAVLEHAQLNLSPEQYAELTAMASPINGQLERMNKYVGNAEDETGGMLGNPGAVILAIVVVGVVLVILASIYAVVESYRISVTNRANEMIEERKRALEDSYARERESIMNDPTLTMGEQEQMLRDLEVTRREEIAKLPVPKAAPKAGLALPALGTGMLVAGAAAIGLWLYARRK